MIKCTESDWYKDDRYLSNYTNAINAGYMPADIAPYHFYRFNKDPIKQAEFFVSNAQAPNCAFVVDVEDVDNSAVGKASQLKLFLDVVEYLTKFKPIIYTASWWWTTARWGGTVPWAKDYALVEAEYPLDPPSPDYVDFDAAYNWTKTHKPSLSPDFTSHSFWQFTSKANGIIFGASSKYLDVQSFNGTLAALSSLYTKIGNIITDPRPGNKIDMLQYIRGPHGMQYEMRRPDGAQERHQIQWDAANPQVWYIVKGENQGHYEKWSFDDNFIYLEMDTSPAPASDGTQRYYTIKKNGVRSPKYRRWMGVGEVYNDGGHFVQFNSKATCQPHAENSGNASNNTTFSNGPYADVFYNNITLPDVIKCQENSEMQYWAKNFGRVRWESAWGSSQLSEIHGIGSRPDIQREFIPCVS